MWRAGISPLKVAETMAESKTLRADVCPSPMGHCTGTLLVLDNFALKAVTRLERGLTTLERRDDVNFPVRSFQSQTEKCFRSEDVTQVCWYRLKSGDWQLPPFHCRSTAGFSDP